MQVLPCLLPSVLCGTGDRFSQGWLGLWTALHQQQPPVAEALYPFSDALDRGEGVCKRQQQDEACHNAHDKNAP